MNKHWKKLAAVAAVVAIGATGAVNAWANQAEGPGGVKALGGGTTESKFVPVEPCRVVDTRVGAPAPNVHQERNFQVRGTGPAFAAQGGKADGCGIPATANAVEVTITGVDPVAVGFLRAYPGAEPDATFLNYSPALNATNTGTIKLCDALICVSDLRYILSGGATDVVVEVQGYYTQPLSGLINADGTVLRSSRMGTVTHPNVGEYVIAFDRSIETCAATASPVFDGFKATVAINTGGPDIGKAVVKTQSGAGVAGNTPVFVDVTC
ncbi:MAG: hypothetical protein JWM47_2753 [Acidimicrobiales bacterium]|nr:hypothetical protein [Acidimicrobiales bacterium]